MRRVALSLLLLAGCDGEPTAASPPAAVPSDVAWIDVDSRARLAEVAAEAVAANKGLMLDVRADWCVPCKELEAKTFTDEGLRTALQERFVAVRLDVTDPTPDAESLQGMVGGAAMPWVVFWSMSKDDAKAFREGEIPPPAKTVSTYVSAEELLALLPAV